MNSVCIIILVLSASVLAVPVHDETDAYSTGHSDTTSKISEGGSSDVASPGNGDVIGNTGNGSTTDGDDGVVSSNRGLFSSSYDEEDDEILLGKGMQEHITGHHVMPIETAVPYPVKVSVPIAMEKQYPVMVSKHYPATVERPVTYTVVKSVKVPVHVPYKSSMYSYPIYKSRPISMDKIESYLVEKTVPLYVEDHMGLSGYGDVGLSGGINEGIGYKSIIQKTV